MADGTKKQMLALLAALCDDVSEALGQDLIAAAMREDGDRVRVMAAQLNYAGAVRIKIEQELFAVALNAGEGVPA
jgi:hypothetical protein